MSAGFVQVPRAVCGHHIVGFETAGYRPWMWLLHHCAYKPRKLWIQGRTVEIQPGQLCHSLRHMASAWGVSVGWVRRFLKRLEGENLIRTESGTGQTRITLLKSEVFQGFAETEKPQPAHERHASGTIGEEGKKIINTPPDPPDGGEPSLIDFGDDCPSEPEAASEPDPPKPRQPFEVETAREVWNEAAKAAGFSESRVMNDKLRRAIRRTLTDLGGLDQWREVVAKVRASPFLCGKVPPSLGRDKPFRASLTWATNPTNLVEIMDGKYDAGPRHAQAARKWAGL